MFDVSVRGCGYKAAGSAINGLWWPELGLQKARGHSMASSVLLPSCLSDSVHHSLALTLALSNGAVFFSAAGGSHNEAKCCFS